MFANLSDYGILPCQPVKRKIIDELPGGAPTDGGLEPMSKLIIILHCFATSEKGITDELPGGAPHRWRA